MTKDQTSGVIERIAYALIMAILTKLVAKGYLTDDMAVYIATGIIAAGGSVYAWFINRPQNLMVAAAKVAPQGTVIVTTPEVAKATPASPNIVSSTENAVVAK